MKNSSKKIAHYMETHVDEHYLSSLPSPLLQNQWTFIHFILIKL